jgi:hypothetical protein
MKNPQEGKSNNSKPVFLAELTRGDWLFYLNWADLTLLMTGSKAENVILPNNPNGVSVKTLHSCEPIAASLKFSA